MGHISECFSGVVHTVTVPHSNAMVGHVRAVLHNVDVGAKRKPAPKDRLSKAFRAVAYFLTIKF